jgi:hypothetical protein
MIALLPSLRPMTEKKIDALEVPGSLGDLMTFCMTADFPTPAAPTIQRILALKLSHWEMKSMHRLNTAKRVPG